ncbi:MAG: glycosyltransferase [Bacteroides sp.]|nr:glycosyltransferase [Roseburia sp.]MCM1347424.1 glycosyltransferase [Bacteroides sp.]MCM1421572.1 glycosyltransferase [Bacteroides sp.]
MHSPLFSIIIPVYNTEKYLRRCLDSILAQTYNKWECILVDDGSNDNSGAICDEYSDKDLRFHVFHKDNAGVCSARNAGLANAHGEWVTFVDSDDWCDNDWLANFIQKESADLIVQGFKAINWLGNPCETKIQHSHKFYDKTNVGDFLNEVVARRNIGYLWCRAFRTSIMRKHGIIFDEQLQLKEDEEFILHYMTFATSYLTVVGCSYHYDVPNFILKYKDVDVDCQIQCNERLLGYALSLILSYKHAYMKELLSRFVSLAVVKYRKNITDNRQVYSLYRIIYKENASCNLKTRIFMMIEQMPNFLSVRLHKIVWKILRRK